VGEVDGRPRYRIAWLEERFATQYSTFINLVVAAAADTKYGRGYALQRVVSEANGVGAMPSQELQARMAAAERPGVVEAVYTDVRLKQDALGFVKLLCSRVGWTCRGILVC
jgi:hypothetical protein